MDRDTASVQLENSLDKRNLANTFFKPDRKDTLGRKTVVHNTNADLVDELRAPSDANDVAIQEALMTLFNAQVQDQIESVIVKDQANRAKKSDSNANQALKTSVSTHALKASDLVSYQINLDRAQIRV